MGGGGLGHPCLRQWCHTLANCTIVIGIVTAMFLMTVAATDCYCISAVIATIIMLTVQFTPHVLCCCFFL